MKTKNRIIIAVIAAVILAVLIIIPIHLYNSHYSADDWYKPLTCWYCHDPEINIEIYEDGQKSSMVIDGKETELRIGTSYNEVHFLYTDDDCTTGTYFIGEAIPHLFSDDITVKVFESNIDEVQAGDKFVLHKFDDWF